jgi:hypothetical protein
MAAISARIEGSVDPRFTRVRDAFAENLTTGADVGAGCCVYTRGRMVVACGAVWRTATSSGPGRKTR